MGKIKKYDHTVEVPMQSKEIQELIFYHQAGLDQYRQHMSPAAQYFVEQTIKALEELLKRME